MKKTGAKKNRGPLLILPTSAWFLVFLVIPIFIVVLFSLLHKGAYGQILYELDWNNYARAFEPIYLKIVGKSFWLASYTTFLCLAFSYPLAYLMARSSPRARTIWLGLVVVPFWTNFVIRVYALKLVLGENGLINRWLMAIGLVSTPLQLTDNTIGVAVGMVYNYLPFMILPLYVALEKLDFTLMDAAYDLGATKVQTFLRVLLPLSLPGIVTGSLFVFIPAFGEFVIPDLLGGSQSMYVGTLITETFLKSRDWPFGSALSSFLVLLTMGAFVIVLSKQAAEEDKEKKLTQKKRYETGVDNPLARHAQPAQSKRAALHA